jgi:CPA2 family monovalent cation:H+ antiporter-2
MHGANLLRDLVILVAIAIPVVVAAQRLRIPSIAGFLVTGTVIGPHALALISDPESVQKLADVGVVLLLFAVGLELSLARVKRLGRVVIQAGGLQVAGTIAVVAGVAVLAGVPLNKGVFLGALAAASSSVIVLKSYTSRDELDSPHGRAAVAVAIFQDLAVVPLMLAVPLLAGVAGDWRDAARTILLSLAVIAGIILFGRLVLPWVLERIAETRNREIFTLAIVVVGLGAAWVASLFGLSLALGAFIAGLVVSESEYGMQALSDVLPFRDAFSGVFFASVGMLLNVNTVVSAPILALSMAAGLIVVKASVAALAVRSAGRSTPVAVMAGLGLAQVGEFSFVLAAAGAPLGLISPDEFQHFLSASVLSMLAAPFLIAAAPSLAALISSRPGFTPLLMHTEESVAVGALRDHCIIVGYGLNGSNVARALRGAGIPYIILEQNSHAVRRAREEGEPIYFGDGTYGEVLERVGIERARVLVFAIAAVEEERRGVSVARRLNPQLRIIVRTRYVREIAGLQAAGADEVVPEEFETSVEIFARVLRRYSVPSTEIRREVEAVRRDHYEAFRNRERPLGGHLTGLHEALGIRVGVDSVAVEPDAPAVGSDPVAMQLRRRTGATVIAVLRKGEAIYEPEVGFSFAAGDTVVMAGRPEALDRAAALFRAAEPRG